MNKFKHTIPTYFLEFKSDDQTFKFDELNIRLQIQFLIIFKKCFNHLQRHMYISDINKKIQELKGDFKCFDIQFKLESGQIMVSPIFDIQYINDDYWDDILDVIDQRYQADLIVLKQMYQEFFGIQTELS